MSIDSLVVTYTSTHSQCACIKCNMIRFIKLYMFIRSFLSMPPQNAIEFYLLQPFFCQSESQTTRKKHVSMNLKEDRDQILKIGQNVAQYRIEY